MLPNGILGIVSTDITVVERFMAQHRDRCAEDQQLRTIISSILIGLGGVTSDASRQCMHLSRSEDGKRIGVFDGVNFDDWDAEREPYLLLEKDTSDINREANGQFLAAAASDRELVLLTDPWGTLPVYVYEDRDTVAFSVSLHVLSDCFIKDATIRNGGG